ncbi:hypothetical protein OUY22_27520 [Nonomuraea sp. MCN248]|uniref:PE domain-containing protein n=1 Tax=Nonomuraea corallina TaxID=2989783 RepID=A0ABT4SIY9_9ACTN|nr:hypothetical protein [Nonomuraea corallina]MDA0637168.1 hypothetical protein [Nonomuraea corallina]
MAAPEKPAAWPGLQAERDGVGYDAKKIANIARELRDAMKPINGSGYGENQGSIHDLQTYGSLKDVRDHLASIRDFQAGETFQATLAKAHQEFLNAYGDVLENFDIAIALVEAGAGTYQATDVANQGG